MSGGDRSPVRDLQRSPDGEAEAARWSAVEGVANRFVFAEAWAGYYLTRTFAGALVAVPKAFVTVAE